MVWLLAFDSETVNVAAIVPALPSVTDTSLMEIVGCASSLLIVPTPWLSAIVAFVALDRFTLKVSFGSNTVSPLTVTLIGCEVWPAVNVKVPELAT